MDCLLGYASLQGQKNLLLGPGSHSAHADSSGDVAAEQQPALELSN
jgi:hypothetical protein